MAPDHAAGNGRFRWLDALAATIGLALLLYTVLRALQVPFTHDESLSYLHYVSKDLRTILTFDGPERANNHLLNSLLAKTTSSVFGVSEFTLRLPNLIAHASLLLFSWLILRSVAPPLVALSGFLLANFNRHLLELLSLERGYGLSLGFLLPATYCLLGSVTKPPSWRRDSLALLLLGLGVLSQFVILDVFLAAGVVLGLAHATNLPREIRQRRVRHLFNRLMPLFLAAAVLAMAVGPILFTIASSGGFYTGGRQGIWLETVTSLVWLTLLPAPYTHAVQPFVLAAIAGTAILIALNGLFLLARRVSIDSSTRGRLALVGLFAVTLVIVKTQSLLLGVNTPTDRIGIFLIPLFWIAAAASISSLEAVPRAAFRHVEAGLLAAMALAASLHTRRILDVEKSHLWWFDADVRDVLADLQIAQEVSGRTEPLHLGSVSHCQPALNFYAVTLNLAWLDPVVRVNSPSRGLDYYYGTVDEEELVRRSGLRIVKRYPRTGNILAAWPGMAPERP